MALDTQSGGTFGDMLRVTDTGGGCISFGAALIGSDAEFLGPDFSIGFRFKKINTTSDGTCLVGIADTNGEPRRYWLQCVADSTANEMVCSLQIDSTVCGVEADVVTHTLAEDTAEHSVAVTYDADGDATLYVDGVEVDSATAPCADVSGPADGSDVFSVWGSTTPGVEVFYIDNVFYSDEVMSAAQVLDIHTNGLPGDS